MDARPSLSFIGVGRGKPYPLRSRLQLGWTAGEGRLGGAGQPVRDSFAEFGEEGLGF